MTHKAYLVAFLGAPKGYQGLLPVVTRVDIFSSGAKGLTACTDEIPVDILEASGTSYEDAQANLMDILERIPGLDWAYLWVRDGVKGLEGTEAAQAGFDIHMSKWYMLRDHLAAVTRGVGL